MITKNIYSIPISENSLFLAISDPKSHYDYWKHAIDFSVDFNVPILAAQEGQVVDIKDDSTQGGDDQKYAALKYQNYITIKHLNNEYSHSTQLSSC